MPHIPHFQVISVNAVVVGDRVFLVSDDGKRLTNLVSVEDIATNEESKVIDMTRWHYAAQLMAYRHNGVRNQPKHETTKWGMKCLSMSKSIQLRKRFRRKNPNRHHHTGFKTTNWKDAVDRMWHQGSASYHYHKANKWERWARTVSRNHNRKAEFWNERTEDSNDKTNHVDNRTTAIQMCIEWEAIGA